MWALGIIVWEMIMGCTPLDGMDDENIMMHVVQEEFNFEVLSGKTDVKYIHILHGLLDKDPKTRWDAN